jgi:hypothetical protein
MGACWLYVTGLYESSRIHASDRQSVRAIQSDEQQDPATNVCAVGKAKADCRTNTHMKSTRSARVLVQRTHLSQGFKDLDPRGKQQDSLMLLR